jgi:hypothetical protein
MRSVSAIDSAMNSMLKGLLRTLDNDAREVVSGDLLEARETPGASVLQVFSLIIRRQLDPWAGWQPWLVLAIVACPLAVVLSQTARHFACWSAIYSWMLINNTNGALLRNAGFWSGVRENGLEIGKFAFILLCCSWTCGRLVAKLSCNARISMAFAFVLTSLFANIFEIPSPIPAFMPNTNGNYFPNGPVFANLFYRSWFPLMIYAITVLVPLLLGFIHEKSAVPKSKALDILFYCSTALVVVGLFEQRWLLIEMWSWQIIPVRLLSLPNLLPFASVGPTCLLLLELGRQFTWRQSAVHS